MELAHTKLTGHGIVAQSVRRQYRPTVSIALIHDDDVIFVQSAKDEARKTWILPQGGMLPFERLSETVCREVHEELGFKIRDREILPTVLGTYVNHLPLSRGAEKPKLMFCVAVRGKFPFAFSGNGENLRMRRVGNPYDVWNLMGDMIERRPAKFRGTCAMLSAAHARGLLSWSCAPVLAHLADCAQPETV